MKYPLLGIATLILVGCASTPPPEYRAAEQDVETHAVNRAMFGEGEGQ